MGNDDGEVVRGEEGDGGEVFGEGEAVVGFRRDVVDVGVGRRVESEVFELLRWRAREEIVVVVQVVGESGGGSFSGGGFGEGRRRHAAAAGVSRWSERVGGEVRFPSSFPVGGGLG